MADNNTVSPKKDDTFDTVDVTSRIREASNSVRDAVGGLKDQAVAPLKSVAGTVREGVAWVRETDKSFKSQISSWKSEAIDGINGFLDALTGGNLNIGDFGNVVTYQDGFKVNSDELFRIASKSMGFDLRNVEDMQNQLGNAFIDELSNATGGLSDGFFYMNGGRIEMSDEWDRADANTVFDFLSRTSDSFDAIVNIAGENSILNTMLYQIAGLGMYDGFDALRDQYRYLDDYYNALMNSVDILLQKGDIKSLKRVLEILDEDGVLKTKAKYPNFVETVLRNFNFSKESTPGDYPELKEILLEIIIKIEGPNWYISITSFGDALNLGLVNTISKSSQILLEDDDLYSSLIIGNSMFTEESAQSAFSNEFPKAVTIKL